MIEKFEFHDIEQNTDEWFELRLGKITQSNAAKVMAHFPKKFGEPAMKYARAKALEIYTGKLDETDSFSNAWTDRGHEYEPIAIERYEREYLCDVTNGGFFCNEFIGDSPDGVVGSTGRLEVKVQNAEAHWQLIKNGGYPSKHKWQIQGHLLFGAEWCDFVSFCPEFPEHLQIYRHRVFKDEEIQEQMLGRYDDLKVVIDEHIEILKTKRDGF